MKLKFQKLMNDFFNRDVDNRMTVVKWLRIFKFKELVIERIVSDLFEIIILWWFESVLNECFFYIDYWLKQVSNSYQPFEVEFGIYVSKFKIYLSLDLDGIKSKYFLYGSSTFHVDSVLYFMWLIYSEDAAAVRVEQDPYNDQRQPRKICRSTAWMRF